MLLSEGLDLCIRGRKLDATITEVETGLRELQATNPEMTRSHTLPLWVQMQYDEDLAAWEAKARAALSAPQPAPVAPAP